MATETVTDKAGRKIGLRDLDPGDMLDLLEAAGTSSTNEGYMRYAMVIASLSSIDDVPVPAARTKEQMRGNAKKLGNDGFAAVAEALFGKTSPTADDSAAAAKN